MHLTNNSVQKFSEDYGKVAEGNQLSFCDLRDIMENNSLDFKQCEETMHDHVRTSLNATIKKLNENNRKFVF